MPVRQHGGLSFYHNADHLPITCDFFYKNNFEDNVTKYNQKIKLGNPNSTSDNLV